MELSPPNILMEPTLHRPRVVVSPRRAAHLARKVPINAVVRTDCSVRASLATGRLLVIYPTSAFRHGLLAGLCSLLVRIARHRAGALFNPDNLGGHGFGI